MNSNREEFKFRLEKTTEIVKCLNELGINITENEILNPEKSNQCQAIYEQLAEICTGISREEMTQPALLGLSEINYPDLHDESLTNLNVFRACSKMMETCGIHNFTIKDIMTPDPKRTRRFLSGIINFLKFREERLILQSDLNTSREILLERLNSQKEKSETISTRLNRLRDQTAEDSKLVSKIEEEIKEIESQISSINQQQSDAREETTALKVRNGQLKEDIVRRAAALDEAQHVKKTLSGQVVSSPDKFRKRIADAGLSLQNEQREVRNCERRVRDLLVWIGNVEDAQLEATLALDAMQDCRAEVDKQKLLLTELDATRQQIEARKETVKDLEQATQQIGRAIGRNEEKLNYVRKQAAMRANEGQQLLSDGQTQLLQAESSRLQLRGKAERCEAEGFKLERELESDREVMAQELNDMITAYKRLERLVTDHLRSLIHTLQLDDTPIHCV